MKKILKIRILELTKKITAEPLTEHVGENSAWLRYHFSSRQFLTLVVEEVENRITYHDGQFFKIIMKNRSNIDELFDLACEDIVAFSKEFVQEITVHDLDYLINKLDEAPSSSDFMSRLGDGLVFLVKRVPKYRIPDNMRLRVLRIAAKHKITRTEIETVYNRLKKNIIAAQELG